MNHKIVPDPVPSLPVVILGAGLSGLSCALRLAQNRIPVIVLEKNDYVGGLAGTIRQNGYSLDFGPHSFFSEDSEVRQKVMDLFDHDPLLSSPRSVKFYYRDKYLDYPLTPFNVLFQMGFKESMKCLASYLSSRFKTPARSLNQETVEEWAIGNFGDHLYQVFFKPYTEQFWKMKASELSSQAIPSHTRLSFVQTLRYLIRKRTSGKNLSLIDREKLPTFYPRYGYGAIAEAFSEQVLQEKGGVETNASVSSVDFSGYYPVIEYHSSEGLKKIKASHIISTLPITMLIEFLKPLPSKEVLKSAKALSFRPLLFLGMITAKQNILSCSYLYTLNKPYNRITEMNRFSPETSPKGKNILAVEIPCSFNDPLFDASPEELFEKVISSLSSDGFLNRSEVEGLILAKSAFAYPIYTKNYRSHLETLLSHLNKISSLKTLGRSAEFRYMDGDQCIRRSFDYADSLIPTLNAHSK